MVLWLFLVPFSLTAMILCYATNPIAVLFCDENGERHGFGRYWQTHDNSCNPSDVTEHKQLPSWLLYDWKKHYKEYEGTTPELQKVGRKRWFTKCIDNHWTLWERFQRWVCRTYWLTRNCSYGFSFWLLGITPGIRWAAERKDKDVSYVHEDYNGWQLDGAWKYKSTKPICTILGWTIRWNTFLGWKVDENAEVDTRAMIANRIAFSIGKEA